MARRTWKQLGNDLDTVIIEVWTGEQITWKRSLLFFREFIKALTVGRESWDEIEHRKLMQRLNDIDNGTKLELSISNAT